jgi:hypothetical protein
MKKPPLLPVVPGISTRPFRQIAKEPNQYPPAALKSTWPSSQLLIPLLQDFGIVP